MAYTYIERAYGKRFEAGQRVRFTEYNGDRGLGVVRGVRGDPQYVRVLFSDGHEGDCHPGSVEVLTDQPVRKRPQMRTFEVVYTNASSLNRKFKVRGVCEFDVLNPCWNNRPSDVPGKHWGDKDVASCRSCASEAEKSLAKATRSNPRQAVTKG